MKKIFFLLAFLLTTWSFGQYMIIGKDSLSLADFKKQYGQALTTNGVESALTTAQNFYLFQQLAEDKKADTTGYFSQRMASKLNEVHQDYFFDSKDVEQLSRQFVLDNQIERQILVFNLEKTNSDPTSYQKVYQDVVSGKLSMEKAIETYVKKEVRPVYIKPGLIDPTIYREIASLKVGQYTKLAENPRSATFAKLVAQRPSLGYMVFGSLRYPNDQKAAEMKNSIYSALKQGKPFNEITAQWGTTPNEKNAGGAVMGSPILPDAVYGALKGKKAGDYVDEPILIEDHYYVFYIYDLLPYVWNENSKDFFQTQMLSSNYAKILEDQLLEKLEQSKDFTKFEEFSKVASSYQAFKNYTSFNQPMYKYKSKVVSYGDLRKEVEEQYKDLQNVTPEQWKVLLDLRVKNFLLDRYTQEFFQKSEVKNALESEKQMIYSQFIYSDYLKSVVDTSAANLNRYYNENKQEFQWEEMADGRVAIISDPKEVSSVKKTIEDPKKWESLQSKYKNKLNKEGKILVSFQQGEMNKDAEIFTKYKVPFQKGVFSTKMSGRDVVIAIDQIVPRSQMTFEESREDVVSRVTEETLKRLLDAQREKTPIIVQSAFREDLERNFKK